MKREDKEIEREREEKSGNTKIGRNKKREEERESDRGKYEERERERAEIECGEREKQKGGGGGNIFIQMESRMFSEFLLGKTEYIRFLTPSLSPSLSLFSRSLHFFIHTLQTFHFISIYWLPPPETYTPPLSHSHSHDKIHVSPCLHFIIIFSVPFYGTDFFLVYGLRLVSGMSKQGQN